MRDRIPIILTALAAVGLTLAASATSTAQAGSIARPGSAARPPVALGVFAPRGPLGLTGHLFSPHHQEPLLRTPIMLCPLTWRYGQAPSGPSCPAVWRLLLNPALTSNISV
jgi:hypothetical protein